MSQLAQNAAALLLRELRALRRELEAYPDDAAIWSQPPSLPNSAGTLALHLAGNLRHFIGAKLGGSDYVRNRTREFEARGLSREVLLEELSGAEDAVRTVVASLSEADLAKPFSEPVAGQHVVTGDFLMALCSHFTYHLGQIDYHRRIVTGQTNGVGALPMSELRSARAAT